MDKNGDTARDAACDNVNKFPAETAEGGISKRKILRKRERKHAFRKEKVRLKKERKHAFD